MACTCLHQFAPFISHLLSHTEAKAEGRTVRDWQGMTAVNLQNLSGPTGIVLTLGYDKWNANVSS